MKSLHIHFCPATHTAVACNRCAKGPGAHTRCAHTAGEWCCRAGAGRCLRSVPEPHWRRRRSRIPGCVVWPLQNLTIEEGRRRHRWRVVAWRMEAWHWWCGAGHPRGNLDESGRRSWCGADHLRRRSNKRHMRQWRRHIHNNADITAAAAMGALAAEAQGAGSLALCSSGGRAQAAKGRNLIEQCLQSRQPFRQIDQALCGIGSTLCGSTSSTQVAVGPAGVGKQSIGLLGNRLHPCHQRICLAIGLWRPRPVELVARHSPWLLHTFVRGWCSVQLAEGR